MKRSHSISRRYGRPLPSRARCSVKMRKLAKIARICRMLLWLYRFVVMIQCYDELRNKDVDDENSRLIRVPGDVIFGGIFPMHEQVAGTHGQPPCGAVKEEAGMQRLEAMLFALDEINIDPAILPNTSLGGLIIDSCSSDTYALDQSMEFVRSFMNQDMSDYKCESGKSPVFVPHKPVTGVIGGSSSVVSIMVANFLRLFKIPQVSYASTSTKLSDKSRFEYFSRVVPPDNFQAQAMVEIVRRLGWKYVSTVAVEGDYGEKGIVSFTRLSAEYNICIAASVKVLWNSKTEDFDRLIETLSSKHNARGVILFVNEDNARKLLQATMRANKTGHFLWIGSDSWGTKLYPVRDQELAAEGAITILPRRNSLKDFDRYYKSLRPRMNDEECGKQAEKNVPHPTLKGKVINCRNVWFREFWSQHHGCSFGPNVPDNAQKCTGKEKLIDHEQEGLVPFVVDAVYAMAHAVHNVIEDNCVRAGENQHFLCDNLKPAPQGQQMLQYLRRARFVGRQGTEVKFNSDGDAFGFYSIYQYQRNQDGKFDYARIGTWKEVLWLDVDKTRWATGPGKTNIPRSMGSENCPLGHVRNFPGACHWNCISCREEDFVLNHTCQSCEPGYAPDTTKTRCIKVPVEVVSWTSPWAVVPLCFAFVGISITLFTTVVFIKYNRTPVIMASGREMCFVLLAGIFSCYIMSFVILSKPTTWNCTYLRIGLGLCLSICYSAILIKTNRLSRIFNHEMRSQERPPCTSPKSQVVIAIVIIAVQLIGAIVWLLIDPPATKEIHPYPLTAILTCHISTFSLMISLVYNMILILMCTLYAFKTRNIPAHFNEAKYIGFTMYSTCIVWLAFVPIFFATNNDYKIHIASLCMCINLSATVALGCLFTPKVYLVLFQPYKNVRPGRSNISQSSRICNSPLYTMRIIAPRSQPMQGDINSSRGRPPQSLRRELRYFNAEPQPLPGPSVK